MLPAPGCLPWENQVCRIAIDEQLKEAPNIREGEAREKRNFREVRFSCEPMRPADMALVGPAGLEPAT